MAAQNGASRAGTGAGTGAGAGAGKGYAPAEGSWVAELEAAEEEVASLVTTGSSSVQGDVAPGRRGEALKAYLRLCRARSKLRQWKKLEEASDKALDLCSFYSPSSTNAARISEWKARFQKYRDHARRERAVVTALPQIKGWLRKSIREIVDLDLVSWPDENYPNANLLQNAAVNGDLPLLEALVAHGAALDMPFLSEAELTIVAPTDASALVMLCVILATHDLDHPTFQHAKALFNTPEVDEAINLNTACAMQLVRLGADPNRRLNLSNAPDTDFARAVQMGGFDGKSAYELAKLSTRTDLVELMEQHLKCTPEERAELVHCRCGSRLPWKACHSFGVGVPPHCLENEGRMMYRVSPLARCPCTNTSKVHYECCWKDTAIPMYLIDANGNNFYQQRRRMDSERLRAVQDMCGFSDFELQLTTADLRQNWPRMDGKAMAEVIRTSPVFVQAFFAEVGPKSQLATWDMEVYAGCLERLATPFFWRDLHWRLNKPELLLRAKKWNAALEQYCDDVGLEGDERDSVIAQHRANPCAPCGRVGCDAFEREVREFQRCSRCKMIAYCGRACQKLDWREHRKECVGEHE